MNGLSLISQLLPLNKLPAAVLVEGDLSATETKLKEIIAKSLCETHTHCGQCQNCHLINNGEHPDVHFIKPHQEGHPIKIEQIREINDLISKTPLILSCQYVLLIGADTMNIFSSNALLKSLEEPNIGVHFILLVENSRLLPKTILSRCWQLEAEKNLSLSIEDVHNQELTNKQFLLKDIQNIKLSILAFLQDQADLMSLITKLNEYALDDGLCLLQFIAQDIIQEQMRLKSIAHIALTVALPPQLWWQFWDLIIQFRFKIKTQTSLQGTLLLSELFLTLKGYKNHDFSS